MFGFLGILVWTSVIPYVWTIEVKPFTSEDQFYAFYENWLSASSPEEGSEYQIGFMELLMNTTVDPCEDFYQFACGNYEAALSRVQSGSWSLSRGIRHAVFKVMEKIITSEVGSSDSEVLRTIKSYYQTCRNERAWNLSDLGKFLKSLGSWPWLDTSWADTNFDWISVATEASMYTFESIFRKSIVFTNNSAMVSLSPHRYVAPKLPEILRAAKALSLDLTTPNQDMAHLYRFYGEISRIAQDDGEVAGEPANFSLEQLKDLAPNVDFKKFLQILYANEEISTQEVIITKHPQFLKDLSNLVAETDDRTIANFIFLQLLMVLSTRSVKSRDCLEIIFHISQAAVIDEFSRRYTDINNMDRVVEIFDGVKDQAVVAFKEWSPDTEFIDKLTSSQLLPPDVEARKEVVHKLYSDGLIDRKSCFNTFLNFHKIFVSSMNNQNKDNTLFDKSFDWRVVPDMGMNPFVGDFLTPPIFHRHSKQFANYAGLGRIMAREILTEIVRRNTFVDLQNELITSIKCYLKQRNITSDHLTKQIFSYVETIRITFRAYKEWLDNSPENEDFQFKGIPLNAHQNFFLANTQHMCGYSDGPRPIMDILLNSQEFKEVFNCPVGSNMNPSFNC